MRVALVTTADPMDRGSWSGSIYHMSRALERHVGHVEHVGPVRPGFRPALGVHARLMSALTSRRHLRDHSVLLARACSREVGRRLEGRRCDVVVAPAASNAIAFLETNVPIVYVSDTTFALMEDYYPSFTGLSESSRRDGNEIEGRAVRRASVLAYPSEWAARSAVDRYGADPARVRIVPFGANLEVVPDPQEVKRPAESGLLTLLFVGRDWERKGGDIALETAVALNERGLKTELVVCGCEPPDPAAHPCLRVVGVLDKSDPGGAAELSRLYLSADFFLLPTRSECYGVVFCEAAAHGLPSIASDTGGVPSVVADGRNGYTLPLAARGDAYASLILEIAQDRPRYEELRRSSRREFDERLNWDAWGRTMRDVVSGLVALERPF